MSKKQGFFTFGTTEEPPPAESGEVNSERIIYENLEPTEKIEDSDGVGIISENTHPNPIEETDVALAAVGEESPVVPVHTGLVLLESLDVDELPPPIEDTSIVVSSINEPHPLAEELNALGVGGADIVGDPTDTSKVFISAIATEVHPLSDDSDGVGIYGLDSLPAISDTGEVLVDVKAGGESATGLSNSNGRNDWVNVSNANGRTDGADATITGAGLAPRGGIIEVNFPDFSAKLSELTITAVVLIYYYFKDSYVVASLSQFRGQYWDDSASVMRQPFDHDGQIGSSNFRGGRSFNIFGNVNTWSEIDALRVRLDTHMASGNSGTTHECDAFEVEIEASKVY